MTRSWTKAAVGCLAAIIAAGLFAGALPAAAGDLDPRFGVGGKVISDFGGADLGWDMATQPDGKIVVTGESRTPGRSSDFFVARYTANGRLDPSFGSGGTVRTDFAGSSDFSSAVAVQPDGKIVVAGGAVIPSVSVADDFALARYNADGTLDASFGGDGKVVTGFGNGTDSAGSLVIQRDGRIVAAGYTGPFGCRSDVPGSDCDFAVARFNGDGSLDASFDGDGRTVTSFTAGNDEVFSLEVQPDTKIVAGGWAREGTRSDVALARYSTNGALDPSFDGDGKVVTGFDGRFALAHNLAIDHSRRILVSAGIGLLRYNADGSLDRSFGAAAGPGPEISADALALQPNDKILVAGTAYSRRDGDFAVARYTTNGTLDTSYGSGGSVATDIGSESDDQANAATLQRDGKLLVAGFTKPPGSDTYDFALARYLPTYCVVPKLKGKTLAAAKRSLRTAHCAPGKVKRVYSKAVRRGRVASQTPRAGARLRESAKVAVAVSRGRTPSRGQGG